MGLLAQVTTGKILKPSMDLIYGGPGVGKTTWASEAPSPVFLPTEEGTYNMDVARFPLVKSYLDARNSIKELIENTHAYETLVIDSLDHLELIIWNDVCAQNSVKEITELAYGKGYALALKTWQDLLAQLKILREKMNIIMICHSAIKSINDPMKPAPYDRHELKLHKGAASLVKETCDSVLFAAFEVFVREAKMGKAKAVGEGKRVLYTHGMPGHEGKNRYGLPYELPLSYEDFAKAKDAAQPQDPATLKAEIETRLSAFPAGEIKEKASKALEAAGTNAIQLSKILNRLQALQEEGIK